MHATLDLNLADALNADELRELTKIAQTVNKPIERVLFEAAKALAMERRPAGEGEVMSAGGEA